MLGTKSVGIIPHLCFSAVGFELMRSYTSCSFEYPIEILTAVVAAKLINFRYGCIGFCKELAGILYFECVNVACNCNTGVLFENSA